MPRINTEIVLFDNGAFVNFWDHFEGKDLCYKLVDGTLYDDEGVETTFPAFIEEVRKIVKSRDAAPTARTEIDL